jgi:hypothetical protein
MAQILILTAEEGEKERLPLGNRIPKLLSQAIFFHILTLIGRQLGYLFFYSQYCWRGKVVRHCFLKNLAQHPHMDFQLILGFCPVRISQF